MSMRFFRALLFLLLFLLVVSVALFIFVDVPYRQRSLPQSDSAYPLAQPEMPQDLYTLFFAGDVMLDRGVALRVAQYGGGDWRFPWRLVADRLRSFDLVFVNHEGVMSAVGRDAGGVYSFNFPIAALDGLLFAGVDVVSLANNHSFDWGGAALCDTKRRLDGAGIGTVGAGCDYAEANAPFIHTFADGSSVGLLGYTSFYPNGAAGESHPGISAYSLSGMRSAVAALKKVVAVVVVSMHWGEEYQSVSNVEQQRVGRMLVDAGADIVVGHHPHTVQEVEEYNGGWIVYSLGNFIFDQYFSDETMQGLTAVATVQGGAVVSVSTEKVSLNTNFQPMFDVVE